MLDLKILRGDALSSTSDALVIPIDGTIVPRDGQVERILGNIGRQFLRRFPAADLLEEIESQVGFPLPLGRAAVVALAESAIRQIVVVSTLHHVEQLDHHAKRALVRSSFRATLEEAARAGAQTLATAVLQGGWRLKPTDAFAEMLRVAGECSGPETHIYVLEPDLHEQLASLSRSFGFRASS